MPTIIEIFLTAVLAVFGFGQAPVAAPANLTSSQPPSSEETVETVYETSCEEGESGCSIDPNG